MDDEDSLFFVVAQLKTKRMKNNEIRFLFIVDKFSLKILILNNQKVINYYFVIGNSVILNVVQPYGIKVITSSGNVSA